MGSTTASHITDTYLASGINDWLSNFGTLYYHPDANTDSNGIEQTYSVMSGEYEPDALIHFDTGELVALSAIGGADWEAGAAHLQSFWQNSETAVSPTCFELPSGDKFLDGILAVSPYSVFGALFNSDTIEDEAFPDTTEYTDARPLTMLYKTQAVQWTKEAVKEQVTDTDGDGVGIDFVGVLVAQTMGSTDSPIGLLSAVTDSHLDWSTETRTFLD